MSGTAIEPIASSGSSGLGAAGLSSLINALAPIFLGSGATTQTGTTTGTGTTSSTGQTGQTSTSTTQTAPVDTSDLTNIITQALQNSTNTSATDPAVQAIIQQATEAVAPVIQQQNTSGIYDSTAAPSLAAQVMGRAVNDAAGTVLNYSTQQQQIASSASDALVNSELATSPKTTTGNTVGTTANSGDQSSNQTTDENKSTAPVVNGSTSALGIAGLLGASVLSNGGLGALSSGISSTENWLGGLFGSGLPSTADLAVDSADAASNIADGAAGL